MSSLRASSHAIVRASTTRVLVFDMAGTVVDEGGIVYDTLKNVLRAGGITFTEEEFDRFHGANKREVVEHFVNLRFPPSERLPRIQSIYSSFLSGINAAYFSPSSPIRAMPGAIDLFANAKQAGIHVALNTGYPRAIADRIIDHVGFRSLIDASVVAEEAGAGRPCPYMIFDLMKKLKVMSVDQVAKVGDTANDMQEGRNAGVGKIIGVMSGADGEKTLAEAGATDIIKSVADIVIQK